MTANTYRKERAMNTIDEMLKLYRVDVSEFHDDSRRDSLMNSLDDNKSVFSIVRLHVDLDAIRSSIDGEVRAVKAEIEEKGMSPSEAAEYLADRFADFSLIRGMRYVNTERLRAIADRWLKLLNQHREDDSAMDENERNEIDECLEELDEVLGNATERQKEDREKALKRYLGEE